MPASTRRPTDAGATLRGGAWLARALVIAGPAILLAGTAAHAASTIFTGPVKFTAGQTFVCGALNVDAKRTLSGVVAAVRRSDGAFVASSTCPSLAPQASCAVVGSTSGGGVFSCRITSQQGARPLRGALSNDVTGASSDAR